MTSSRYPTKEEARATFNDDDFNVAIEKRWNERHDVEVVRFETYINKDLEFDSNILRVISNLIEVLPYSTHFAGTSICRRETFQESEAHVIQNRQSEMHYTEKSPYYQAHLRGDSSNE